MSEQQYRVSADRDKGDDPYTFTREPGDRVTYGDPAHIIVRIERPVPTADRPDLTRDQFTNDESYYLATGRLPSVPTREQIAEALAEADGPDGFRSWEQIADAVLALLQKGGDRD